MLLKRQFERLLLSPADLEPLRDDFRVVGVFNPGVIMVNGEVILMVRVAERPTRTSRRLHGAAALVTPDWSGNRLGCGRCPRSGRPTGCQTKGRWTGAVDVHLASTHRALRGWAIRA